MIATPSAGKILDPSRLANLSGSAGPRQAIVSIQLFQCNQIHRALSGSTNKSVQLPLTAVAASSRQNGQAPRCFVGIHGAGAAHQIKGSGDPGCKRAGRESSRFVQQRWSNAPSTLFDSRLGPSAGPVFRSTPSLHRRSDRMS